MPPDQRRPGQRRHQILDDRGVGRAELPAMQQPDGVARLGWRGLLLLDDDQGAVILRLA